MFRIHEGDVSPLVRPKEEAIYSASDLNKSQVDRLLSLGFTQNGNTLFHPKHWKISSGIMVQKTPQARLWLRNKADGKEDSDEFYHSPKAEPVPFDQVFKTKKSEPEKPEKPKLSLVPKVDEMPHYENLDDNGVVDLRIEKWPISQEEKRKLLHTLQSTGVVGRDDSGWMFFGPDNTAKKASPEQIRRSPKLPDEWKKHAQMESRRNNMSKLNEVFVIKEALDPQAKQFIEKAFQDFVEECGYELNSQYGLQQSQATAELKAILIDLVNKLK